MNEQTNSHLPLKVKSVCVYCGSSNNVPDVYKQAAHDLGVLLAKEGVKMIYGGGITGLMGITANACAKAGGYVVGITTNHLKNYEGEHESIAEFHVVESMHQRKLKMFELSDAFISLPGGLGTLDESFEIMTWKQIGLHQKNIIFVNINNYWDPLINHLLANVLQNGFMREEDRSLFQMVETVDEILKALSAPPKGAIDFVAKWG